MALWKGYCRRPAWAFPAWHAASRTLAFCPGNSGQQTQQIEESGKEEKRPPVAGCDRVTCHGVLGETQDGQAAEVAVSDGYPQWAQSDDAEYCPGVHANRPWA